MASQQERTTLRLSSRSSAAGPIPPESADAGAGPPLLPAGVPDLPSITTPRGGGAVRSVGERVSSNPITGSASASVPIPLSPGRGFDPAISLTYDSATGNGPFGYGWQLSIPSITRKTDKGIPRYGDEDVFILSGAEDLVPWRKLDDSGQWNLVSRPEEDDGIKYIVQRFRPRTEGLFSIIESWTRIEDGDVHWRSISQSNVTSVYGTDDKSRVMAVEDEDGGDARIFSWLIRKSWDDRGSVIEYIYKKEDDIKVETWKGEEVMRKRASGRYLKNIRYGNRKSRFAAQHDPNDYMFEAVLDYGEHDPNAPKPGDTGDWDCRVDSFSSYRSGFEVRTHRLCKRILMFHHFPDEADVGRDCLVRSTDLVYSNDKNSAATFLKSVTQTGYAATSKKSLPAVVFDYSEAVISDEIHEVDTESLENIPYGVDGQSYQWVDLDGEGLPGVLFRGSETWYFKANLGKGTLAPIREVSQLPNARLSGERLMDLSGNGQLDLVDFNSGGFYERTPSQAWEDFTPFDHLPNVDWDNPNLRLVDLTGDGLADVLITEHEVLRWYPSESEAGYGPDERVPKAQDEELGPQVVFSDTTQTIHLADMSGDGLVDLVRVRNGEVCYWPSLGYGRFGEKVDMGNAPWFDHPEHFDGAKVKLADIDGNGCADICYVSDPVTIFHNRSGNSWTEGVTLNVSVFGLDDIVDIVDFLGNGTASLVISSRRPSESGGRQIRYVDLMRGSKPFLLTSVKNNMGAETTIKYAPSTKFYIADKLAGTPWVTKIPFPVQCVERVETRDKVSGNLFVSRYSYHHGYFDGFEREYRGFGRVEQWDTEEYAVMSRTEDEPHGDKNFDMASKVPPVWTRTWYHTGAYLEQDTISTALAKEYFRETGSSDDSLEGMLLPDTVLPSNILVDAKNRIQYEVTAEEAREACRALRGSALRQEVFGLDDNDEPAFLYNVTETNHSVELLQPKLDAAYAIFFQRPLEEVSYAYELDLHAKPAQPADPRVTHKMVLAVDEYANVLLSAAITYGRREANGQLPDPHLGLEDLAKQRNMVVTFDEAEFTNMIDDGRNYRPRAPCQSRSYELINIPFENTDPSRTKLLRLNSVRSTIDSLDPAADIPYEDYTGYSARGRVGRRKLEHSRTIFSKNALTGPLDLGQYESLALPYQSYKLSMTPALVDASYVSSGKIQHADVDSVLGDTCGYLKIDGEWWQPSGRVLFSPQGASDELAYAREHFFLPLRYRDPFHSPNSDTERHFKYDTYDLLVEETKDAYGNRNTAGTRNTDLTRELVARGNNYRLLRSTIAMDPNRNQTISAYDALGFLVGIAAQGKPNSGEGDLLDNFDPLADTDAYFEDPLGTAPDLLKNASSRILYDLFAYQRTKDDKQPQPVVTATISRETHVSDLTAGEATVIHHSFVYSDGLGRDVQKKARAEAGPVPQRDSDGRIIVIGGKTVPSTTPAEVRWVGTGWTVFNNKGAAVRTYEPFFSDTYRYDGDVRVGIATTTFYDPLQRTIGELFPNHAWTKVVFDSWKTEEWDSNDTCGLDPRTDEHLKSYFTKLPEDTYLKTWTQQRLDGDKGTLEKEAAEKSLVHSGTPSVTYSDSAGRTILTVAHNKTSATAVDEFHYARLTLDVEGNEREIFDAEGRKVMVYNYDMLGHLMQQSSMENGEKWLLNDVLGGPVYSWKSRGYESKIIYDRLRRPKGTYNNGKLIEKTVYGDDNPDHTVPEAETELRNLRMQRVAVYDQAGVIANERFDFKGNQLESTRKLAIEYKETLDWSHDNPTERSFHGRTKYDALDRGIEMTVPDGSASIIRPKFNIALLLEEVMVTTANGSTTNYISNIDYNAKGQRTKIVYGNGVTTNIEYDELTNRVMDSVTTRGAPYEDCPQPPLAGWPGCQAQSLHYTYDAKGNVTHIRDDAQQTIYFRNKRVDPSADFTYDALYRLIRATGREHIGQAERPTASSQFDRWQTRLLAPGDGNAMARYTENYLYDRVGNIKSLQHAGADETVQGWTRSMFYDVDSQLEPAGTGVKSNRLGRSEVGGNIEATYEYDEQGNMTKMGAVRMAYDHRDQLRTSSQQVVNTGLPETTWYVYDMQGKRVRKVTTLAGDGTKKKSERMYIGDFEVYQEYDGAGTVSLERETVSVTESGRRIAMVETRTVGTDGSPRVLARYQLDNHIGSSALELDDEGRVVSYEEYTPYGSTSYQAVRNQTETPKRYRFSSKERDEETGLSYFGARYYAPWICRWTSCDPKSLGDGPNMYLFVHSNPINLGDDFGAMSKWLSRGIGVLQVIGGGLEVAAGVAGLAAPTGVTQVLGGVAVLHGGDTVWAGAKRVWSGEEQKTGTEQAVTWTAKKAGASDETAEKIGFWTDTALGFAGDAGNLAAKFGSKAATTAAPKVAAHTATEATTHAAPKVATKASTEAAAHGATEAAGHSTGAAKATKATEEGAAHAKGPKGPETHATGEPKGGHTTEKVPEPVKPEPVGEKLPESPAAHGEPAPAPHAEPAPAPAAGASDPGKVATHAVAEATEKLATRNKVLAGVEKIVIEKRDMIRKAIAKQDRGLLQAMGATPKQINHVLNTSSKVHTPMFGNVLEKAVAEEIAKDPFLKQFVTYLSKPGKSTPDFLITIGDTKFYADLTTGLDAARHVAKYFAKGFGNIHIFSYAR